MSFLFVFCQLVDMLASWMQPRAAWFHELSSQYICNTWTLQLHAWLTFLVMLAEDMVKALLYKPLCGGLCSVLAEFMVKWRWDNWSQNKCLKQDPENAAGSLLLSYMYAALATGILVACVMVEKGKRWKNSQVLVRPEWSD
jgi:hypothetical protein